MGATETSHLSNKMPNVHIVFCVNGVIGMRVGGGFNILYQSGKGFFDPTIM